MDEVPSTKPSAITKPSSSLRTSQPATNNSIEHECEIYAGQHSNLKCPIFFNMSVNERVTQVKQSGLCFNCLRKGHQIRDCPSELSCSRCSKRHHSMLHFEQLSQPEPYQQSSCVPSEQPEEKMVVVSDVSEGAVSTACSSGQRQPKHVFFYDGVGECDFKERKNVQVMCTSRFRLPDQSGIGVCSEIAWLAEIFHQCASFLEWVESSLKLDIV